MQTEPERPSDPDSDTLLEFAASVDQANRDIAQAARRVRRRRASRRAAETSAELVLEFIAGLLP